ncbi:MAG: rhomboid family intramembrane serine protease [Thermodesulfobacteriota bacterium]|nr:rhomboid family intramembrane serine protease [Thermodesulfobacteriota bacterium]
MLIIPVPGKINWKNPPWLTLGLITVNCLIFFLFQLNDNAAYQRAYTYYIQSGLAAIEVPEYIAYKNRQTHADTIPDLPENPDEQDLLPYAIAIMSDAQFLKMLQAGKIISEGHPAYEKWRSLRTTYKERRSEAVAYRLGFKPGFPSTLTMLTHMFLHGGAGHLIGNMIFLWLAGCLVEMGIRRFAFLPAYLFTGLTAVCLFWAFNPDSAVPLVGASGAIAGLMGIVTTLYATNRINIFYSLGFYFNYVKVPAIILLPIWVGKEVWFEVFQGDVSNVAYLAHTGGFIGGAAIGLISKKLLHIDNTEAITTPAEDKAPEYIEESLALATDLKIKEALTLLDEGLKEYPDHLEILKTRYQIARMQPDTTAFHTTAGKLLKHYTSHPEMYDAAYRLYKDYTGIAKRPKLPAAAYLRICTVLITLGKIKQAEKVLAILLKKNADLPGLPTVLWKLAKSFQQNDMTEKYDMCRRILSTRYADSTEAAMLEKQP